MIKLADIIDILETEIPLSFQEEYDNSGLQAGDRAADIESILLALDITEEVIDEAIETGSELIISHHPPIFSGLKKLTGDTLSERVVIKAIKNDISLYSAHTNLDVIPGGVSYKMAERISLQNVKPLLPLSGMLAKIVVFVPVAYADSVREAMFKAGAGNTGNYDHCSFNTNGVGTFRAKEGAKPFVGEPGNIHSEKELRIEVIAPRYRIPGVIRALSDSHPYEEAAYDIFNLENPVPGAGMGVIGDLKKAMSMQEFLDLLKDSFEARGIRYSSFKGKSIKRVALCGGSGSSLTGMAERAGADAFVTGDIKYHSFFDADHKMLLADIGHYESEKYSLDIIKEIITKKFPKFAVRFSKISTNPVNYLPNGKSKSS